MYSGVDSGVSNHSGHDLTRRVKELGFVLICLSNVPPHLHDFFWKFCQQPWSWHLTSMTTSHSPSSHWKSWYPHSCNSPHDILQVSNLTNWKPWLLSSGLDVNNRLPSMPGLQGAYPCCLSTFFQTPDHLQTNLAGYATHASRWNTCSSFCTSLIRNFNVCYSWPAPPSWKYSRESYSSRSSYPHPYSFSTTYSVLLHIQLLHKDLSQLLLLKGPQLLDLQASNPFRFPFHVCRNTWSICGSKEEFSRSTLSF